MNVIDPIVPMMTRLAGLMVIDQLENGPPPPAGGNDDFEEGEGEEDEEDEGEEDEG